MPPGPDAATAYFASMRAALAGLRVYLADAGSPLYKHSLVAGVVAGYVARLEASFAAWENRLGFAERFRIARAESGFPVYQTLLELESDRAGAAARLASLPDAPALRREMADFILRHKAYPGALKKQMAERLYLESLDDGAVFSPFVLPETIRVSVNPKTQRPFYVVHWGVYDGSQMLPMIYMASIEDSSPDIARMLVTEDGQLNEAVDIPLPVGGLLNPRLARDFDASAERHGAYSLSPATIAQNIDQDFPELHPKQLRRVVLGPFYGAGLTEIGDRVSEILTRVRAPDNRWVLTWTIQEVFSQAERPAKRGLWSDTPAAEEYFIDTANLEAVRQGVSGYEKHALVPHDAYQALYAEGEAKRVFDDYRVHVISGNQVISEV
ncbi:hypothetical protein [Pseudohoeflea coraliihabitans]|uniref:Uncharacterized protein n=1 Tax=Pseudohoeflea coraliihabitans TaxID=2860393 RepID=A0ABS6WJN4_9HYPH|nr:hypothetical protein [Pseudohoeflea sp. DP4N28-3]MBW3096151.1 hypothetical protein [Pseudohoeflea sp. DP4N28-3]